MIYSYRAYGLTFSSDTPVSALREERTCLSRHDVVMSFGPKPDWVREAVRLPSRVDRPRAGEAEEPDSPFTLTSFGEGEFFQLAYDDGTRFIVDGAAQRLWGTWLPPLTTEDVATYLVGPVMGFVLRRRGVLALHASSVCVSGNAVILCGSSESGKSTAAAALALRGVPVLAEDISPVKEHQGSFVRRTGLPANLFVARRGRESIRCAGGVAEDHADLGEVLSGVGWSESNIRVEEAASQSCLSFRVANGRGGCPAN